MGSRFVEVEGSWDQTSIFGTKRKQPVYLQFVQGIVTQVVTAKASNASKLGAAPINSIIAQPHGAPKVEDERSRYMPLFRGIVDVPVIGDPVLLCTISGINYYMGPLNTEGGPNFNKDQVYGGVVGSDEEQELSEQAAEGISPNFRIESFSRLEKPLIDILDDPSEEGLPTLNDIHGDMIFEGRHGNSIRIGSRSNNPYIYISNGRGWENPLESTLDGTLLAITENGTLREHFIRDLMAKDEEWDKENDPLEFEQYEWTLADDEIKPDSNKKGKPLNSISKTFATSMGRGLGPDGEDDPDIDLTIYGYEENQYFLTSDRITFNAKKESIFVSAFEHIHFGAGNTMTFSTSNNMLFNVSQNTTINSPTVNINGDHITIDATDKLLLGDPLKGDVMSPAVLGNQLSMILKHLLYSCQSLSMGVAQAIATRHSDGVAVDMMTVQHEEFQDLIDHMDSILSTTVFLET